MKLSCRTCLKISKRLHDLFADDLPFKIREISAVEVSKDDGFSSKICEQCFKNVHLLYDFRNIIIKSAAILKKCCVKEEVDVRSEDSSLVPKIEDVTWDMDVVDDPIKDDVEEKDDEGFPAIESDKKGEEVSESENQDEVADKEIINANEESDGEVVVTESKKRNKVFKCSPCNFTTVTYNLWRQHKRKHQQVHKVVCNICGISVRKDNIKKHIVAHSESPVTCTLCEKVFRNAEALRKHIYRHRSGTMQCPVCGKVYKSSTAYAEHKNRHALGDVKTVPCPMCGKLFYNKTPLLKHIRSHTGERPYPCQYCKKGFSSSYALKTHIRQHTNEKPYACNYCDVAFPQKVSLKLHLKSKHSDNLTKNDL